MLTMTEQKERRRISQILHDDLQQILYGIQMKSPSRSHPPPGTNETFPMSSKIYIVEKAEAAGEFRPRAGRHFTAADERGRAHRNHSG